MACKRLSDLETNGPMADFVARNIPNGLLERSKAAAALSGLDLREWLVSAAQEKLERMVVNGVEQAVRARMPVEPAEVEELPRCEECGGVMLPQGGGVIKCSKCRREVHPGEPEIPECPDACGPMTWNKFLNRWECKECQFVMKGKRA